MNNKMNMVLLGGKFLNPGDLSYKDLEAFGNLTVYYEKILDKDKIIEICKDADAIFLAYGKITKEIIEALPKLKYIGVLSTGYDHVDIKACQENNVLVTNIPSYGTEAVAQFSLALLLEITSRVGHHESEVKKGRRAKEGYWNFGDYPLIELYQKTIGLVGLGKIGLACAKIYKAMGIEVIAYNRSRHKEAEAYVEYVELEELYQRADIIDLHLPLTEKTRKIIDKKAFDQMKDGVIIINSARGKLIDEDALIEALDSGKVFAAGLDVVRKEPIRDDNPLLKYDNVIITPHMARGPRETRQRLLDIAAENFKGFLDGKNINTVKA
jgi:glycerate dehydrogenase